MSSAFFDDQSVVAGIAKNTLHLGMLFLAHNDDLVPFLFKRLGIPLRLPHERTGQIYDVQTPAPGLLQAPEEALRGTG